MHLDSTFLGVHLDRTFLGVHLDRSFLGVHLDSKAVQEQQRSTGNVSSRKTASCGPLGGHEQDGTGTAAVDWASDLQEKQLLLSEARTRAAGGGEVKTGEEELLAMQELRLQC